MIIEGNFVIAAPIQQVWEFFLDIPRVSACVPGAEKVEQVDDETFSGSLVVKVGPIKANFSGQATLSEVEPPHRLTAQAQGKDKNTASMVSTTFTATLTEIESSQTEVAYKIDAAIRGRLGQFGQGVIRETSKQIAQVFAECVQAKIAEQSTATDQADVLSDATTNEVNASTETTNSSQVPPPTAPSLFSILVKSIIASIGNWFRALRPGS